MPLTSPATMLIWTVMSFGLFGFLLYHLWSFDKFKCLKWHTGPYSGTFKRAMTYTYIIGVPMIMAYSTGMTIFKYHEGWVTLPDGRIIPKPVTMFDDLFQRVALPLLVCFSFGWAVELITHLQELCFWLFLVNSQSAQQDWFQSLYFRVWVVGSVISVIYMPLVTGLTHNDPVKCEAWTFLAGGIGSLIITLWFLPILFTFPSFLDSLKLEGVDKATIVRLTTFHELNIIRIIARFIFCVPLLVLGIDGARSGTSHPINENLAAVDALAILAGFGFVISSGITLVIFFPRSVEAEIAARDVAKGFTSAVPNNNLNFDRESFVSQSEVESQHGDLLSNHGVGKERFSGTYSAGGDVPTPLPESAISYGREKSASPRGMRPNRRVGSNVELGGIDPDMDYPLTEQNLEMHTVVGGVVGGPGAAQIRPSRYHPAAHNFTSPLDIGQRSSRSSRVGLPGQMQSTNSSRLTFNRGRIS